MKIAIIGGGPAGLYAAILLKKQRPEAEITVYERNRADDTFGFGVVFSDATLDNFEKYDPPSYRRIVQEFAYWDDIAVHFRGTVHRVGGNGFCGCSRRTLLMLLQERARELGVGLQFRPTSPTKAFADADLIVLADGINSRFRKASDHFPPEIDLRPNRFAWMGARAVRRLHLLLQGDSGGHLHRPLLPIRTRRQHLGTGNGARNIRSHWAARPTEAESARFMEHVFAEELNGHKLITNRSLWRQFPMIRCARWVKGTSCCSGTPRRPRISRSGQAPSWRWRTPSRCTRRSWRAGPWPIVWRVLSMAGGKRWRKSSTRRMSRWSGSSMCGGFWPMHPTRFAFGVMTRSKAITYDDLALRAPDFVQEVDALFAREVAGNGEPANAAKPPMFQPFRLRGMRLANRVVVSPMCQYSAEEGLPTDWHMVHYGARATGGAGLIYTEMTCPSADARITPGCTGLWNDAQEAAWTRIVAFTHAHGAAKMCLQLGHGGRKGSTRLMWDAMDRPLQQGGWPIISASAIPYFPDSPVPRAMDRADMDRVVKRFSGRRRNGASAAASICWNCIVRTAICWPVSCRP